MGKEHDLLNAGKTGNVSQIDKLLGQRAKKSGLQSIMGRSVNPNFQDEMGYSALHYAALHGHRSAVELLLKYDASANIPDNSGNYPLHLAAFNGHADVCRILINSGPSRANVNEQNGTEDTAMHSAAQSKSSQVVAVLLENHADPFLRNCRKESALDLAAQYGRMENVKLLLSYHPTLLQDLVKTHSPLHLAARNGHIDVVSNLLGCGMSVNNQCDTGTALHEAALFGKLDVCNFLLQCDVDISVKDKNQMTVMDLLMNHPSSKTKEISTLIYKHSQSKTHSNSFKAVSSSPDLHPNNMPSRSSTMFNRQSNYNDIPNPRPVSGFRRGTYDAVPAPKSKQEIMTQMNYDLVPNPQSRSASEPFHVKNADRGTSLQPTSDVYSLLGAPVQKPVLPSDEPALTPKNVKEGYTMLGVPVVSGSHMTGTQPVDYSTVRSEGVVGSPSSASRQKFPTGGREGEPLPMQAMVTKENKAYYQVEPHTSGDESHSFSTMDSRDYEEVPREAQRRDLQIPLYQTPPTHHQPPSPSPSPGTGDYGFVGEAFFKPKPTKQEESPASLATSPAVYEIPPSFKSREVPTGDTPVSQPKTCPLDIPSYELVGFRKTPSEMGPETFPMSALPGYEPMGLENQSNKSNQFGEYEVLAPQTSKTVTDVSDYEVLPRDMMSQQQRGTSQPSLAKSPPVYEIAPTPRLATEEPRPAPQPSTLSLRSPTYEFAPPPRPRAPSPPQNNVPDVPMVEKEPAVPPPRPRPYNQYQVHTVQPKAPGDAEPASKQGMPAPYEQVRLEAPKGRLNLDQKPVLPPRTSEGGDYCTLDLNATGQINPPPLPARDDISSSSSLGSASGSDLADTPGVPPPSPSMAAAAVFEALEPRPQSPEKRPEKPVPAKRTLERRPVPAPRRDSLNDKPKWYNQEEDEEIGKATETGGLSQDPFSFPPTKDIKEVETSLIPEKETTFTSLHNRYSPFGSRENIVEENEEEETEKGKEEEESSPLLYENVLFKRSDSTVRKSINKKPVSPVPSAMEEREEETKPESEPQQQQPSNVLDTSDVMDEDAEWEKIEALLMSINEIEMPDNNQMEDAGQATSVPEWLKFLGLSKYEPNFMNNGFDNLGFLNGGVLEDLDLDVIGVNEAADKNIILEAMKSLPTAPRVAKLPSPPSTVEEWLGLLYLSEYLSIFVHHGYTTMDRVKQIWEVELTSVLEINLLGHRNRILASLIEPRRMTMVRKSRKSDVYESKGNYSLDEKVAELDVFCPTEEQPTGISGKVDADMLMKIADEMINDENLKKKAEKKKRDNHWQHEPEVLLKGCVNYSAQYLGSQTVREIVGVSSTVEASRKMRMSTAKLQKIPSVILAVSVNGIKFIDARTKFVVSNHQMCNVSYITQDPEDKRVFAYIAKDAKVNKHYCHVFRVDQTQLSDVITMTIGQAFELAYEQFMHIQDYLRKKRYLR